MSDVNRNSLLRVIALEINEDGAVSKKNMAIDRESQLENTLLKADYPDIRVATIDIPQEQLDDYQKAMVERSMGKKIVYGDVEYALVGASASAKNGKYYAVDAPHADLIAKRFRYWPEAAMTYPAAKSIRISCAASDPICTRLVSRSTPPPQLSSFCLPAMSQIEPFLSLKNSVRTARQPVGVGAHWVTVTDSTGNGTASTRNPGCY